MSDDALRVLRDDHQAVQGALADLQAALERLPAPEARRELEAVGRFLAEDLARHLAREENVLFPALERHIGREGGPIAVMLQEHDELRRLWPAFQRAVAAGTAAEAAHLGRSLGQLLAEHLHKEDWVLFPLAERVLTAEELREVRWALAGEES